MTNETWGMVRGELLKSIGKNNFSAWIEPITFDRLEDRTARFHAPTSFIGSWVSQNFGDLILRHLASAGVGVDRVEIAVGKPTRAPAPATNGAPAAEPVAATATAEIAPVPSPAQLRSPAAPVTTAAPAAQPRAGKADDLPGAQLNPNFTFDAFVVGKPNELAHAAARRVAEGGEVTFNPLFLYGGVGLGKTHLMHAIAWELRANMPEARILYLSAEQFMYRFVRALREQDTLGFKQMFRSVDVLMVDDVQFIAGKTSTQEEFFHTFNALVEMGKQIVISGDRAPVDMDELDARIASRLQCGLVVDLHPTDYELRLGVLQHKAETMRQRNPSLNIAPGVLEFIAQKVSSNIRVLEGALTRLFAFADLVRKDISMEMTQDCLSDILRATDRKVTMDEIIKKTCEYYNIRQADMMSANRARAIARPRQVAMFLCKKLTTRSLPEIGRKFGGRDHTTILYGVRKIEELMQVDSQIAEDAEILRRALEA
ncbi:Chromosomal replication initiator protein DnaA [Roseibacterium elongatum DSM 19469]|uniref:Chromosomal replication initiator protein DnaA n=1 Tax=Roseicyclus elongatus DSM 19469 TaxID=1294273 RepID=W8S0L1_9RHOB|nr:chromosomal replication initiator protein DnaA [Roseibacterium elongatum]AHM03687.1 Chromosomal replication initiator protein DnaA [Roseibacterium elongatum DSM 19469]